MGNSRNHGLLDPSVCVVFGGPAFKFMILEVGSTTLGIKLP